MSKLPFDEIEVHEVFRTLFSGAQTTIAEHIKSNALRRFGLDDKGWLALAWNDPDWAKNQILRAKEAAQIAEEVAQNHVLPHFQRAPSMGEEDLIVWKQGIREAQSEAMDLGCQCIMEVYNLGDQEIDKSLILEKIVPDAPTRGGFER